MKKVVDITIQSVWVNAGIKGRGRPKKSEINRERCDRYWKLLAEAPDKPDSAIFGMIAQRELKKERQAQQNRGLVSEDVYQGGSGPTE